MVLKAPEPSCEPSVLRDMNKLQPRGQNLWRETTSSQPRVMKEIYRVYHSTCPSLAKSFCCFLIFIISITHLLHHHLHHNERAGSSWTSIFTLKHSAHWHTHTHAHNNTALTRTPKNTHQPGEYNRKVERETSSVSLHPKWLYLNLNDSITLKV